MIHVFTLYGPMLGCDLTAHTVRPYARCQACFEKWRRSRKTRKSGMLTMLRDREMSKKRRRWRVWTRKWSGHTTTRQWHQKAEIRMMDRVFPIHIGEYTLDRLLVHSILLLLLLQIQLLLQIIIIMHVVIHPNTNNEFIVLKCSQFFYSLLVLIWKVILLQKTNISHTNGKR